MRLYIHISSFPILELMDDDNSEIQEVDITPRFGPDDFQALEKYMNQESDVEFLKKIEHLCKSEEYDQVKEKLTDETRLGYHLFPDQFFCKEGWVEIEKSAADSVMEFEEDCMKHKREKADEVANKAREVAELAREVAEKVRERAEEHSHDKCAIS